MYSDTNLNLVQKQFSRVKYRFVRYSDDVASEANSNGKFIFGPM